MTSKIKPSKTRLKQSTTSHQPYTFMPNEIFSDINCTEIKSRHRPLAYTYLYYVTHLYRYCLHHKLSRVQTQACIKSVLGYNEKDKAIDYLIKEGGILELKGYVYTTADYPVEWYMDEDDKMLSFKTIKEFNAIPFKLSEKNFKVKLPLKSMHRSPESQESKILDGIFYDPSNTHKINFSVFEKCLSDSSLGTYAFYIYGYIKHMNGLFPDGYVKSRRSFPEEMNLSENSLYKYIDALESASLLYVKHEKFVGVGGTPNSYIAIG